MKELAAFSEPASLAFSVAGTATAFTFAHKGEEGCLSVPGIYDGVERSTAVRVRALDAQGQEQTLEAEGLLSICIQHEPDHLLGKVFVEYLSPLKRTRIKSKLVKRQREARA